MRRFVIPVLIVGGFLAAALFQPSTEAQAPALTTIGRITEVSERVYNQSFNHGFPALARAVCDQLGVPLEVRSLQKPYWDRVVSYALEELREGRTPSA